MCSYHGWQFDEQGQCTHILQDESVTSKQTQQYCVVALPSQQESGLLWVWPDPKTPDLAAAQDLQASPLVDTNKGFV